MRQESNPHLQVTIDYDSAHSSWPPARHMSSKIRHLSTKHKHHIWRSDAGLYAMAVDKAIAKVSKKRERVLSGKTAE